MTQDQYREEYKKINKLWNDSVNVYKQTFVPFINSETVLLEAGCGFSNLYRNEYGKAKKVIGVDISAEYLAANDVIQEKIVSDLSNVPQVPSNSVDLIVSAWVLEHLETPDKVFSEFQRMLKPGGHVVFLTPNSWNYVVMLNKIIPHWFRLAITTRLGGKLTVEPMPTFYRANSIKQLNKLATSAGLKISQLKLNSDPTYVAINKLFFWIGSLIEKITPPSWRVHIIGVLQKL